MKGLRTEMLVSMILQNCALAYIFKFVELEVRCGLKVPFQDVSCELS